MIQEDKSIFKGNNWNPAVEITENSIAKDCTGYECTLVVKNTNSVTEIPVIKKDISWTSQATGKGEFGNTSDETNMLEVKSYFYEIFLHRDDSVVEGYRKTIKKGKLTINSSLGLN